MSAASHDILVTAVTVVAGGIFLLVLSRRINVPGIVMLLLGGVVFGPQAIGLIKPESFGDGLLVLVEISVGLILFEGGLTLKVKGYRSAPAMIKRLLTLGILITWFVTAIFIGLVVGTTWQQAIMAASLVIVTGPTVIAPLLKRIQVIDRLHNILKWEAVLIDPIGVFIAVLCFEWLGDYSGTEAIQNLGLRLGVGLGLGIVGGLCVFGALKRRLVPADVVNIFTLASAVLIFGLAEAVISKSGLLAVTVAGFALGVAAPDAIKEVRKFKAELTDLLIASLFMLLAARLEIAQFGDFGLRGALAVAAVLFIVRPLCIFLCGLGLDLTIRERAFLSWVAPRGIVAASMASLFAISLEQRGVENARFVETFTYSVIVATIMLQGMTAGPVAKLLGVRRPEPTGWLIVGAHVFARHIAGFIRKTTGYTVVMVDSSASIVQEAQADGHQAVRADARDIELAERHQLNDVGHVLALTDNEDLNARVCDAWSEVVGPDNVFRSQSGSLPGSDAVRAGAGQLVWPSLPRPSALASEISQGTTVLRDVAEGANPPAGAQPLIVFDGKQVRLCPQDGEEPERPTERALYIRRYTDALRRSVDIESILILEKTQPLPVLLEAMLERLTMVRPQLAEENILDALLERETSFPSVVGEGVAVPHAYSDGLDRQLCAVAAVPAGLEYPGAADPVELVFLLISPRADPKAHLTLLGEIARFVIKAETREAMKSAKTPADVMTLIRRGPSR